MQSEPDPLVGFRHWMLHQRGLADHTISRYERLVLEMLPALGDNPSMYDAAHVRSVLLDQVRGKGAVYAKSYITALHSFLKYLSNNGQCRPGLNHAVPTIPQWKLSALPRYLEPEVVERVIAACDLGKPHGVRDQAVLLLLARLGLRAGDIVSMRLDDLDWDAGTLKVRGKSRKEITLPLAQDVGDAVLRYLVDARPAAASDRVFLCANAPVRPLARSATVSSIVMLALRRADVTDPPSRGAHLLRHSAATAMIRSGISYAAIATMLRHQSADMTAYYAKVDVALLLQVAQPWPEETSC
jgi:integrase